MADLQLQAAKVSSLARAIEGSVDLKHDVPSVPKSSPIKGFETLVIPSSKAVAIDKREVHNISLPKMGQIVSMFAQYTYTGVVTHAASDNRTFAAKEGPALANTEIVRLLSNSRELSRMTSQDILIKVKGLPAETRDALLRMNGSELHQDAYMKPATGSDPLRIKSGQTTKRDIVVLCPLPFACAFPGSGAAGQIDASFLEELQVEITTRPAEEAFQAIGSNSSKATACSLSLVVNYSQMDDKHRQKMIAAAYKPGKPLQILSTSYELLGHETKTKTKNSTLINSADDGDTYQPETFRFRSSSSCMARAIHYYVSPDEDQSITTTTAAVVAKHALRRGNQFATIRTAEFRSGGRTVFNATPERALAASLDRRYGALNLGSTDLTVGSHLTYRFAKDDDTSRFSGGMALAGASSQEHIVEADLPRMEDALLASTSTAGDVDLKFTCYAVAEKVVVFSVSPSDGSIKVSLST